MKSQSFGFPEICIYTGSHTRRLKFTDPLLFLITSNSSHSSNLLNAYRFLHLAARSEHKAFKLHLAVMSLLASVHEGDPFWRMVISCCYLSLHWLALWASAFRSAEAGFWECPHTSTPLHTLALLRGVHPGQTCGVTWQLRDKHSKELLNCFPKQLPHFPSLPTT